MLGFVKAGGWLMLPLLICSVLVLAITIERFWSLRSQQIAPGGLLRKVMYWLKRQQMDQAKLQYLEEHSPLGRLFATTIQNIPRGIQETKERIHDEAHYVLHDLQRFLNMLGTIAVIAPLLGLLGTVMGMIQVFSVIMLQGTGNPATLAGGISEALITTAVGMIIAIPALISHRYFMRKVDDLVMDLEQQTLELLDFFRKDMSENSRAVST